MSSYKTRTIKILEQLQSVPGQLCRILGDGTRTPATGTDDSVSFTIYSFPWHDGAPTACPVTWGYDGSKTDLGPISASLFEEALKISGFTKRIESVKKKLDPLVSGTTIICADGSRKTLPVDSMIQELLWHSAEIERIECDEPSNGLLAELLQGLKGQTSTEPLEFPEEEPIIVTPSPASAEAYKDRRVYKEKRLRELTAPKSNPPNDDHYCI